jgi:catechol 2,3-dioxygenase-like lactoylglutathione lyase family enzyme
MELNQITLPCEDYDASVAFYRRLGLTLIVDSPPRYARFEATNGATLSIHSGATPGRDTGFVVYFEVSDVDATVRDLESRGLEFEQAPRDERWLWREARLRDPAGNVICVYHAGGNRRFPPWRVAAEDDG